MCSSSAISKGFLYREFWKSAPKGIRGNVDLTFIVIGGNPSLVLEKAYGQKGAAEPCQMTRRYAAATTCNKDI